MSEESNTTQLVTNIRQSSTSQNNMLDLVAALARNIKVPLIHQHGWAGRLDPEVERMDLIDVVNKFLPKIPPVIKDFLSDPSLSVIDCLRRAYASVSNSVSRGHMSQLGS